MSLFVDRVVCLVLVSSVFGPVFVPSVRWKVASARASTPIESLYASSLFREGHLLDNVPELSRHTDQRLYHCLMSCMHNRPSCKAFNYAAHNGTCILLIESLCANETYELTEDDRFAYFDLMNSPDYESKYLSDPYCQVQGKCSGFCYPRKPLFVQQPMTREKAAEYCKSEGRKLAQPKSQAENTFYGDFGRKSHLKILEVANVDLKMNKTIANRIEKQIKDAKYWVGLSDEEFESYWLYDDGSPVSDQFSAWAVAQPDNGGTGFGAKAENCAALELREYNWIDVSCNEQLHFFCA